MYRSLFARNTVLAGIYKGDILSNLAADYGYHLWEWKKIWENPKNEQLVLERKDPEHLLTGDKVMIPITCHITLQKMAKVPDIIIRWGIWVERSGTEGKNVHWLQTVFDDNQPMFPPLSYSVDLPTDDDLPFYYTATEESATPSYRTDFHDAPRRYAPQGRTTNWRAVLSIGIVTGTSVSIIESIAWGVDFPVNGKNTKYGPRAATPHEIEGI